MSIVVPILTEFKSDGIQKAVDQFKSLEGAGAKAQFAIKKAAIPAAAALTAVTAGLLDATKAAMEDQQAQQILAGQLQRTTGATTAQIASVENWISAQGRALGVSDDELRPALAKLASQTHSVTEAQKMLSLAMDIAAGTGKPLEVVTTALAKAAGGQTSALQKLSPELKGMIKDGLDLEGAMSVLTDTFHGAATDAANTAEGGFKRLKLSISETKESVGAALLPVVEKALPILTAFGNWAQEHPQAFTAIAAAIGAVSISIMAVNAAMALNPFTAIAAGVALLVTGVVLAYKKFDWFREGVNNVINFLIGGFEHLVNGWIMAINGIIRAWNLIPGHKDVETLAHVTFGRIGGDNTGSAGQGTAGVRYMASGGIVTAPTLAVVGEAGPEAVIPLSRMGDMNAGNNITINVNGGDPNAVVAALRRYMQINGSVPIRVAS